MARFRVRCPLSIDVLEERLMPSAAPKVAPPRPAQVESTQSVSAQVIPPAGDTLAVLNGFSNAYLSRAGDPNYNAAYDLNHNGKIGQDDGRLLLHTLPPLTTRIPLALRVTLAPQDQARGHVPTNLGGVAHSKTPIVLGHTTPGALIFTGTGTLDLKLRGPVVVADDKGDFSLKVNLTDGINQLDLQAVDPYGQQKLMAFPIYWLNFAAYEQSHPRKT